MGCVATENSQWLYEILMLTSCYCYRRGLANALVNLPFMIIPWIAAFIADSTLVTLGWRWGIGLFAIILPICSLGLIIPLFLFQRRMAQLGAKTRYRISLFNFVSHCDLGGMVLLTAGFALLLLPLALAGTTPSKWSTPWVPALMAIGGVLLLLLLGYESSVAAHPLVPPRFLRNISLVLAWLMGLLDTFAFSVTHTYMYPWATVVHAYTARDATFLTFTAGCMQVLIGLLAGFLMFKTRKYKWLLVIGVIVRLVGYGVMLRLRGATNSTPELFIVQIIQGTGSGIILTTLIVIAQVVVPRIELSQSTALQLLIIYMGNAVGSTAAGAIYTNSLRERLEFHFPAATVQDVDEVFNTISEVSYPLRSPARLAINRAYSDVMRYMTQAALGASIGGVVLIWWLPDLTLTDEHNLAGVIEDSNRSQRGESESWVAWWWRTGRML